MKLREKKQGYKALAPITRTVAGTEQRQRKMDDKKAPPPLYHQEDTLYHTAYVNRVSTEMARPNLGEKGDLGGFDVEKLRIVGLARCVPQCVTKKCLGSEAHSEAAKKTGLRCRRNYVYIRALRGTA